MVDMRDIFRQKGPPKKDEERPMQQETKPTETAPGDIQKETPPVEKIVRPTAGPTQKPAAIADVMRSKAEIIALPSAQVFRKCQDIYKICIDTVDNIIENIKKSQEMNINRFLDIINLIIEQLEEGKDAFIELAYSDIQEDYLKYHLVNTRLSRPLQK